MILHLASQNAWRQAMRDGAYRGDTLDTEGFIHCSTPEQIDDTAQRFFKGAKDLVLLEIDREKVTSPIRYEEAGNGQLYPHIYGPLNLDAVIHTRLFCVD